MVLLECVRLDAVADRTSGRAWRQAGAVLLTLSAVAACVAGCSLAGAQPPRHHGPFVAQTRPPSKSLSVLTGGAGAVAAEVARRLFASAPIVIVASADSRQALVRAVAEAERVHAPLLLAARRQGLEAVSVSAVAWAEIKALRPRAVLAEGVPMTLLSARLRGVSVTTDPARLPATRTPAPQSRVALLVRQGANGAETSAAAATAQAAGAQVVTVRGYDPRADSSAVAALSAFKPKQVIAVGAGFGPARRLAGRVAVAVTGVQLPGGGQVLFPGHRLVALYGHPGTPALGALGQQDLNASIARARKLASLYRRLSKVPVIPTFEIIASVAQGANEPEGGTYSYMTPAAEIQPWVRQATAAGMYVVLDLQAGRANLIDQARQYRRLLELPNVGLAIDPEWKLGPGQMPLRQIGSVTSEQVNSVINWLAALTARHHLPQKLLVLHQFRLSMIMGEQRIDTRHDDLAILIHMDGQGTPGEKQQTWDAVTGVAPSQVYLGWKNFFVKDHPMLTPSETMARTPQPVMISYQ